MHTNWMKMAGWIQDKTRNADISNENFKRDAMVKPITTYGTREHLSFSLYVHVIRRDAKNIVKEIISMKVDDKILKDRLRLIYLDRVGSYQMDHQAQADIPGLSQALSDGSPVHIDPKLTQNREVRRKAITTIDPGQV